MCVQCTSVSSALYRIAPRDGVLCTVLESDCTSVTEMIMRIR